MLSVRLSPSFGESRRLLPASSHPCRVTGRSRAAQALPFAFLLCRHPAEMLSALEAETFCAFTVADEFVRLPSIPRTRFAGSAANGLLKPAGCRFACGCESVARFPGWSTIITRSGQNGNLPLHPINRQQAYYTGIQCVLQAFFAIFRNFFPRFSALPSLKIRFSCASRPFVMSPLSGVSIMIQHLNFHTKNSRQAMKKILCSTG